ncbi:hypothetical protein [Streptomyces sp. NPDC014894]|uniref:hypothetical protein n=1 Tax=Streptomyces sp. NPDC014894 TaxID=3364931 RepID=UPI0036F4F6E5
MFIFARLNLGVQELLHLEPRQHLHPTGSPAVTVPVVLLVASLVIILALLAGIAAGKLARLDGASYPSAIRQAATAFTVVITLAAAVTAAFAPFLV